MTETVNQATPQPFNLARFCLTGAGAAAEKPALLVAEGPKARIIERWSYGELREAVLRVAGGFAGYGLPRGARVLLRVIERGPEAVRRAIGQGLLDH